MIELNVRCLLVMLCLSLLSRFSASASGDQVPLYRLFEVEIINASTYENPLKDVELSVIFEAPSGQKFDFYGFYDGDGAGGLKGHVWKIRFMPNEVGQWKYTYSWSDETKEGGGTFSSVLDGSGKGILQPYQSNPHWLAYNGVVPVWLKSYYETGHGSIGQDFEWVVENVYSPLVANGYNHLQVNWLLSLCCFEQYYKDGPAPETLDLLLYEEGNLLESMNLEVWRRMEQHLGWLNDHDIGVHMFLGVDGSRNGGPDWSKLSEREKEWLVRYMVARLGPFANLSGWNFVWEVPGDRLDRELGFARLIAKYDIFNHLRTYEDEFPRENEYDREAYNFAMVENHRILSEDKSLEKHFWKEPFTHHMACLLGYKGKPVVMCEGNALWRRFWQERTKATQDELRQSAWACATAGASFIWNGHASENNLYAHGAEGLPFESANPYIKSERAISVLAEVMSHEVDFYRMSPHDELLADHPALSVYLLAEVGHQYLTFSTGGAGFSIQLEAGAYTQVRWVDAKTGEMQDAEALIALDVAMQKHFMPPNQQTDWVLIIRN